MRMALKVEQRKQLEMLRKRGITNLAWGKGRLLLPYPQVLSEDTTLDMVLSGKSIGRFGDGELRICLGGTAISQRFEKGLKTEMLDMLRLPNDRCLVGIPNVYSETPKFMSWLKYANSNIVTMYKKPIYASAFITRPDSAPWINNSEFQQKLYNIWRNKKVGLVIGTERSLYKASLLEMGAKEVVEIWGTRRDAYYDIERLQNACIDAKCQVYVLCLGATATVLAWRLANKGLHAVDLGHIGMYIKHMGQLYTHKYIKVLNQMHSQAPWGLTGQKFVKEVLEFYAELSANNILDYGCGSETLAKGIAKENAGIKVYQYDPGIPKCNKIPFAADLVTCTDVMEHIEPQFVENVLNHIKSLAIKGVFFTIALANCKENLPDGRNTHLSVHPYDWWLERLKKRWNIVNSIDNGKHSIFWGKTL
jgi:hypothetical protein